MHRDSEGTPRDGTPVDAQSYASAILNILADSADEKAKLTDTQRAILNILDDFAGERSRLEATQKAVLNVLEDSADEKARLAETQRAVLNILDDFSGEQSRLEATQKAVLNVLEDSADEKARLADTQRAVLNILDDFNAEKHHLEISQKAILNILEDLGTERLRLEKATVALEERGRQLEAVNQELEAFSYAVAHDLRAPLRAVDSFSQILAEDCAADLNNEGREHVTRIRRGAVRMGRLIDDILRLSRVGRQQFRRERVNLSQIAGSIADELRTADPGRPAEFSIAPDLEEEGDSALIAVALRNLLENAWKYSAGRDPTKIEFGAAATEDGSRAFFVCDNGCGFDMRYAGKLFAPFQRLHRTEEFEGTGIGLATVKRIVGRHGGRAWIESVLDQGTTAYFTLGETGGKP